MYQGYPGCVSVEYCLCLLVECKAFVSVCTNPGALQHILHLIASIKGNIQRRFLGSGFAQKIVKKLFGSGSSTIRPALPYRVPHFLSKSKIFTLPSPLTPGFSICAGSMLLPNYETISVKSRIFPPPSALASPATFAACASLPVESSSDKPSTTIAKVSFFMLFFQPNVAYVLPIQRMEFEILNLFVND